MVAGEFTGACGGLLGVVASSRWWPRKLREWWLLAGGGLQILYRLCPRASVGLHDMQVVACTLLVASDHM